MLFNCMVVTINHSLLRSFMAKKNRRRGLERTYSRPQFVAKLRRLADARSCVPWRSRSASRAPMWSPFGEADLEH